MGVHVRGTDGSPYHRVVNDESGNSLRPCDYNVNNPVPGVKEYKRGVGREDYAKLAEAFRRNIELGMGLLEKRQTGKSGAMEAVYSDEIRTEAEALIKENLTKLRAMTT